MSAHTHSDSHASEAHYIKIWAILVGLLVVSVVGPMTGIRVVMLLTAFGIAIVKAYLVAKNFMHVDVEKPIVHWILAIALVFMVLLYAGVAPDVGRDSGQRWVKSAGWHHLPAQPEEHHSGGGGEGATGH